MLFDLIILIAILGSCIIQYILYFQPQKISKKWKKKKNILRLTGICAGILLITIFHGSFIEPQRLIMKNTDIQLKNEKNYKIADIALVTDLHVGHLKKESFVKKLVNQLINNPSEVVFLGGDFLAGNPQAALYLEHFKELTKTKPVYAVWGNHDFHVGSYNDIPRDDTEIARIIFEKSGIILLENENILIEDTKEPIWLLGVDSVLAKRNDFAQSYYGISPEDQRAKVVLAHNPDIMFSITEYYTPIDIILSGHTHGGQIRLPLLGAIPQLPIYLGQYYDKGLFDYKGYKLFVSSGVGETGTRARLFNPPEISMISIWK